MRQLGTTLAMVGGFGALALLPGLAGLSAAGLALALVGPLLRRRFPVLEPLGEIGTVAAVVIAAAAWFVVGSAATVMGGLLIYLQVHRRAARTGPDADRVTLVIAALMLVAAAGVTRAPALGVCIAAWGVGLPLGLLDDGPRRGPWAGLLVGVLALSAALFAVLPRSTPQGPPPSAGVTGFSPEVQLGDLEALLDDPQEVFRASVTPTPEGRPYWRGLALDDFDGTRWRTSATPDPDVVPPALPPLPVPSDLPRPTWTVDVQMVEGAEGRLFLPGKLLGYAGPEARRDALGSWTVLEGEPLAFVAWVDPFVDRRSVGISEAYMPPEAPLDPRIAELARRVAGVGTPEERVARLTDHLRAEYPYARRTYGGDDPLVEFLFERQGGHCEYFASALAVMVRAIGLPSRVVNGFVGGEQNPVTGQWVVRRRDAHSWVEVALPERGWVLFDPTPLGNAVPGSGRGFADVTDAMAATWRSALDWDGGDQARAAAAATSLVSGGPGLGVRGSAVGFGVIGLLVAGSAVVSLVGVRRRRMDRPGAPPSRWARLLARARRALGRAAGRPVPDSLTPRAAVAWVEAHVDAATAETYAALVDIAYDAVIGGTETDGGHARAKALVARLERARGR
ncbi:MAG: DUF3488 and transglutaminase-like domain-containing protein [Myxococcota bacterium]